MSSCFFWSRLNTRISPMPVSRNLRSTALPNVPVPPVMRRILLSNILPVLPLSALYARAMPHVVRGGVGRHVVDHRGPGRRLESRQGSKAARVEAAIDLNLVVGHDLDVQSVG